MKRSIFLIAVILVTGLASCKKENEVKPDSPKVLVKAQANSNTGAYDYQKAIVAKRTVVVPGSSQ